MSAFSRLKKPKPSPRHDFQDRPARKLAASMRQIAACIQTPDDLDRVIESVDPAKRVSFENQLLKRLPKTFAAGLPIDLVDGSGAGTPVSE